MMSRMFHHFPNSVRLLALLVVITHQLVSFDALILSRNKTVTVSSMFSDWVGSRAVDGIYSTDADLCSCCGATTLEPNPWMQVDLGDKYTITPVLVYGRSDMRETITEQNLTGLIIHTDDGREYRPPTNSWYQYDTFFNFQFPEAVSTRYVKLSLPGTRHLVVCEIDVYSDRIISYGKPVSMDSQHQNWIGSSAVDGIYTFTSHEGCTCCAATDCQTSSWLRLTLGKNLVVNYVTIYGRTDGTFPGQSYEGMIIEFDNQQVSQVPQSTSSRNSSKFFEFRSESTYPVSTVTLKLSNNDNMCPSQLVVCELEVFGDCVDGKYGENCSLNCGQCRHNEICDKRSGRCSACEDGVSETDMLCSQVCPTGTYGQGCRHQCGFCRYGRSCQITDGSCEACEDGLDERDLTCKTVCPTGTYGQGCRHQCGFCRYGRSCQITDGNCEACEDGLDERDLTCKTECADGWYGKNCSQTCGNCINNETCTKFDGRCSSCERGYDLMDKTCKTECAEGFYADCTIQCGQCRSQQVCNKQTGVCPNGCEPGFMGNTCTIVCPDGKFGENCLRCCGMCKDGDVCDKMTGHCLNGCIEGYHGKHCLSEVVQEPQSCVTISVLVGSIFAAIVVSAIMSALAVICILRIRKTRSTDEVLTKANRDSNYDSLDLPSMQTNVTYANTVSDMTSSSATEEIHSELKTTGSQTIKT